MCIYEGKGASLDHWYRHQRREVNFWHIITWRLLGLCTTVKYLEYCWHCQSRAIFRALIASLRELRKIREIPTRIKRAQSSVPISSFFIFACARMHRNLRIYIRELTLRGALSSSRCCSLRIRYDFARTWRVDPMGVSNGSHQ